MSGFERLIRLLREKTPLIILAGAGVSVGSGIPLAARVVRSLQEAHRRTNARLAALDPNGPGAYAKAMELAFTGVTASSERRAFLDQLLSHHVPSECHHRIAQLTDAGYLRYVLTTNFDQFLETALFLNGSRAVHVHIYGETLSSKQRIPDALHIVKMHGDLLFEDLGNLEHEMDGRVDEIMTEALGDLLEGAALLTIGYGCQDQNVRRLLEHIASSPRGMDGGFFFAAYDPSEAEKEGVQNIIKRMGDSGKPWGTIVGADLGLPGNLGADVLLKEIMDRVGLAYREHSPFGLGISHLSLDQRFPKHTVLDHHDVPIPSEGVAIRPNTEPWDFEVIKALSKYDVVVYSDNDPLRRKLVVRAIIDRLGERAVYFSDRLSAEPARGSLWNRLHHFTASQFGTEHRSEDLEQLTRIRCGAVIVWDDLDLSTLPPDEGYGYALRTLLGETRYRGRTDEGASPSLLLATPTEGPSLVVSELVNSLREFSPDEALPRCTSVQAPDGQRDAANRWGNAVTETPADADVMNALPHLRKSHRRRAIAPLVGGESVLEALEHAGIVGSTGGRVLVLLDRALGAQSSNESLASLGRQLGDLGTKRTPYDAPVLLDAYALLFQAERWEEAWSVLQDLGPSLSAATGSEFSAMLKRWWQPIGATGTSMPAMLLGSSSRLQILLVTVEVLLPDAGPEELQDRLGLVAETLEPPEQIMWSAYLSRDLKELWSIVDRLRGAGRDDLLAKVIAFLGFKIVDNLIASRFDSRDARISAFSPIIELIFPLCEELDRLHAPDRALLLRDNLAGLNVAVGDWVSANRIRDELLGSTAMAELTAHRGKLFGNQMSTDLNRGQWSLAEARFVVSGMSAMLMTDMDTVIRNLWILSSRPELFADVAHELLLLGHG